MIDDDMKSDRQDFIDNMASQLQNEPLEMAETAKEQSKEWVVRVIDHSGAVDDGFLENGAMEEVKGFLDLAHANAFARAYVRDSIERCRTPGASAREVLESWLSFGENAEICDGGEEGWKSSTELDEFTAHPASAMECDWRALDPRRLVDEAEFSPFMDDEEAEEEPHDIIRH